MKKIKAWLNSIILFFYSLFMSPPADTSPVPEAVAFMPPSNVDVTAQSPMTTSVTDSDPVTVSAPSEFSSQIDD